MLFSPCRIAALVALLGGLTAPAWAQSSSLPQRMPIGPPDFGGPVFAPLPRPGRVAYPEVSRGIVLPDASAPAPPLSAYLAPPPAVAPTPAVYPAPALAPAPSAQGMAREPSATPAAPVTPATKAPAPSGRRWGRRTAPAVPAPESEPAGGKSKRWGIFSRRSSPTPAQPAPVSPSGDQSWRQP